MPILSPSTLTALACPRRYVLEHVRCAPTLAPFASSFVGRHVHLAIQARLCGHREPVLRWPARLLLHHGADVHTLQARALQAMATFETLRPNLRPGLTEVFAELPLPGATLRLRVDHLCQQRGALHLRDWKTGGNGDVRLQLGTYLTWARHAFGTPRVQGEVVNLTGGQSAALTYSPALEAEVRARYAAAAAQLGHLSEQHTAPGAACRYCPYAWQCPAVAEAPYGLLNTRTGEFVPARELRRVC